MIALVAIFSVWEAVALLGIVSSDQLPPLHNVLLTLVQLGGTPFFLARVGQSFVNVAAGVSLALVVVMPLALLVGLRNRLDEAITPIIMLVGALPDLAILSLLVTVIGRGNVAAVAISAFNLPELPNWTKALIRVQLERTPRRGNHRKRCRGWKFHLEQYSGISSLNDIRPSCNNDRRFSHCSNGSRILRATRATNQEMAVNNRLHVEFSNVTKIYSEPPQTVIALNDISFQIHEGEFVCIVGPSGCGKSTLLRMIAGLDRPSSGEIRFRGDLLSAPHPNISMVLQTFALLPWRTVLENVAFGLEVQNVPKH